MGPSRSSGALSPGSLMSTRSRLDFPISRFQQREACERDQPRGDGAEKPGAVCAVIQLPQGAVEPDRLVCLVVVGRLDEEEGDQPEDDRARYVSDRAQQGEPLEDEPRHLIRFRIVEELLAEAADQLIAGDACQHDTGDRDEPAPGRPGEHVTGRLLRSLPGRPWAGKDLDRDDAHRGVRDPAAEGAEALNPAVGALAAVAESGSEESPERVAAETDCEEREQEVTERMLFDRSESSLLVCDLAALPDREIERQQADDPIDQSTGDKPGPREDRKDPRVDESFPGRSRAAHRDGHITLSR